MKIHPAKTMRLKGVTVHASLISGDAGPDPRVIQVEHVAPEGTTLSFYLTRSEVAMLRRVLEGWF